MCILKNIKEFFFGAPSPSQANTFSPNDFAFAKTQLIGGERFFHSYREKLEALYYNLEFRIFIKRLSEKLNGREITDTRAANRDIANEFFYSNANEKFKEVGEIAKEVKKYGAQASAHISIYYAMFVLENEKRANGKI